MCESIWHGRGTPIDIQAKRRRTIATYQTLNNVERLRKFDPSRFTLVIVDEAHHAAAFSYVADDLEMPTGDLA